MNIFITGTDTDVGKTVVTAGIAAVMQCLGYTVGVYKPVQSGAEEKDNVLVSPDLEFVKSIDSNIITTVSYNLTDPVVPSLAATLDGINIDINKIKHDYELLKSNCDFVIVEGAGGILVPFSDNLFMKDLPKILDLSVLIVARPSLGTINHTLLTIEAIKSRGLKLLGVVISGYPTDTEDIAIKTAPEIIAKISGEKIIGVLPRIDEILYNYENQAEVLIDKVINNIDVQELFDIKIPKLSS